MAALRLLDCRHVTDEALAPFACWLGDSETERLARFVRRERRRQFVAGRALLRQLLAQLLDLEPPEVKLLERAGNAPLLDMHGCASVGFSVSHSGHWVACAVSATSRLGLDVELLDPSRNIDELAAQAFDAGQQAWLASRPPGSRMRDFFQLWSSTEARYKLGARPVDEITLAHPELSIVLCSEKHLAQPPQLQTATLSGA
jgi:4'-phosphopantetheinyl transferase